MKKERMNQKEKKKNEKVKKKFEEKKWRGYPDQRKRKLLKMRFITIKR